MKSVAESVFDTALLHPSTKRALYKYLERPTQVLLLIGEEGAGKHHTALALSALMLETDRNRLANDTRLILIEKEADKQEIAIDAVRQLIRNLRVKQPGVGQKRIVLIKDAHFLSLEAQNALLKTLEQPNPDTYFILTIAAPSKVLPTVLSRGQKLKLHPIGAEQAKEHYGAQYPGAAVEQAWRLSEGLAGTLDGLLSSDEHGLKAAVETAKRFLSMPKYERLIEIDKLNKDREQSMLLVDGLIRILKALHHSAIEKEAPSASRLLIARKQAMESRRYLEANANPKLVLLRLVMNLGL